MLSADPAKEPGSGRPGLVSDRVHLLALELRRAGIALGRLLMLSAAAVVFTATAWLALWVGLAAGLLATGLAWGWVLLIVLLINLGAAALAALKAVDWARQLGLPATMRHLTVNVPAPPTTTEPGQANEHS